MLKKNEKGLRGKQFCFIQLFIVKTFAFFKLILYICNIRVEKIFEKFFNNFQLFSNNVLFIYKQDLKAQTSQSAEDI